MNKIFMCIIWFPAIFVLISIIAFDLYLAISKIRGTFNLDSTEQWDIVMTNVATVLVLALVVAVTLAI